MRDGFDPHEEMRMNRQLIHLKASSYDSLLKRLKEDPRAKEYYEKSSQEASNNNYQGQATIMWIAIDKMLEKIDDLEKEIKDNTLLESSLSKVYDPRYDNPCEGCESSIDGHPCGTKKYCEDWKKYSKK